MRRFEILATALFAVAGFAEALAGQTAPAKAPNKLLSPATLTAKAPEVFKVKFDTSKGPVMLELHRDWAPLGVDRFYNLTRNGFFSGVRFFRVIPNFMAQFGVNGDPAVTAPPDSPTAAARSSSSTTRTTHISTRRASCRSARLPKAWKSSTCSTPTTAPHPRTSRLASAARATSSCSRVSRSSITSRPRR